ncbi:MAG: hypothetical protein R3E95_21085 [Thiolinea sp.]
MAVVTIPADPACAEADYTGAGGIDANGDGDLDQPIVINIQSAISGASDSMLDAIDVADMAQVELTPQAATRFNPVVRLTMSIRWITQVIPKKLWSCQPAITPLTGTIPSWSIRRVMVYRTRPCLS